MILTDDAWILNLRAYVAICREFGQDLSLIASGLAIHIDEALQFTDDPDEAAVKRERLRRLVAINTVPSDLGNAYQLLRESLYEIARQPDDQSSSDAAPV